MTPRTLDQILLRTQLLNLRKEFPDQLNKDNALKFASQAIELYITCRRLSNSRNEKEELRQTINSLLDAAEKIKLIDAQLWNSEEHLPLELTSLYLDLSKSSAHQEQNGQPTSSLSVEESNNCGTGGRSKLKQVQTPLSLRTLSPKEQEILRRGSYLYGAVYPRWEQSPDRREFELATDGSQFIDVTDLRLSPKQSEILAAWKRPTEALAMLSTTLHLGTPLSDPSSTPTLRTIWPSDFVQDAASDCSVVASLCAGKARSERGHVDVFTDALYPNTHFPSNGKYVVRFNFNGCFRKVTIDDRLPVSKSSRALHVFDKNNPSLLWPALLEKAYLKIHGGYDFRGSNSGTDIWIMTGWIPEQVFLQSEHTDANKIWNKIWSAFDNGDLLITAGTGKLTKQAENDTGLAGEHDYAVLDLNESEGQRNLLVKNPWLNGEAWKGSCSDPTHQHNSTSLPSQKYNALHSTKPAEFEDDFVSCDHLRPSNIFWMSLNDLVQNFESLYLNWSPKLFSCREDIHFTWDMSPTSLSGRSPAGSFASNPQFHVCCNGDGPIWLLAWKHIVDIKSKVFDTGSWIHDGFISLYTFLGHGRRVYLSRGAEAQTFYVDSPQTLLKLESKSGDRYTVVLSEQGLGAFEHNFTLSAFSTCPITLEPAPSRYSYSTALKSKWSFGSAGGNTGDNTYSQNPQFSLQVYSPTPIAARLETFSPINVHVKLLHGYGQRMYSITARDILQDSGEHRPGCALAEYEGLVGIGCYTIICSTFEPNQYAKFTLTVDTSSPVLLKPIPREGAGRVKLQLSNASFPLGVRALHTPLFLDRLAHFSLTARYSDFLVSGPSNGPLHSPIRLSVEYGQGPSRRILSQSQNGVFSDNLGGTRTNDLDVDPALFKHEKVWVVLERLGSGSVNKPDELINVELWTDSPDAVQVGTWTEGKGY